VTAGDDDDDDDDDIDVVATVVNKYCTETSNRCVLQINDTVTVDVDDNGIVVVHCCKR